MFFFFFFSGLITTTRRLLDREKQGEHILEVNSDIIGFVIFSETSFIALTAVGTHESETATI